MGSPVQTGRPARRPSSARQNPVDANLLGERNVLDVLGNRPLVGVWLELGLGGRWRAHGVDKTLTRRRDIENQALDGTRHGHVRRSGRDRQRPAAQPVSTR